MSCDAIFPRCSVSRTDDSQAQGSARPAQTNGTAISRKQKKRREPQQRILGIKAGRYVPWYVRPNQEGLENRQRRIQRIHGSVSEAARSQGPLPLLQTLMVVILPCEFKSWDEPNWCRHGRSFAHARKHHMTARLPRAVLKKGWNVECLQPGRNDWTSPYAGQVRIVQCKLQCAYNWQERADCGKTTTDEM